MKITLALFWFIIALPLDAQPTQAQYDSLKARIDFIEKVQGAGWKQPQIPCGDMEARRPATTLPNGEYDLSYRNRQFGCAFDPVVQTQQAQQLQVNAALVRLGAVEAAVAGGYSVGTAVFDKVRANKICVGDMDCDPDWNSQIQVRGNYSAVIGLERR